jgi:hypothetical protein
MLEAFAVPANERRAPPTKSRARQRAGLRQARSCDLTDWQTCPTPSLKIETHLVKHSTPGQMRFVMFSSFFRRRGKATETAPIGLFGPAGGVLVFYRAEIGQLVEWSRGQSQPAPTARQRDTEAECWAAIGLATSHVAGIPADRASEALDPGKVVTVVAPQVALAFAVFKTLADHFIARGLVAETRYGSELMSSLRGFVEGAAVAGSVNQRAEAADEGTRLFSALVEKPTGRVLLDLIASSAENWATAIAEQDKTTAHEVRQNISHLARQIPILAA